MVSMEKMIAAVALIVVIASTGYLSYVMVGLDSKISAIEQATKTPRAGTCYWHFIGG